MARYGQLGFEDLIKPPRVLDIAAYVATHPVSENTRRSVLEGIGSTQTDGGSDAQRIQRLVELGILSDLHDPSILSAPRVLDLTRNGASVLLEHCLAETERLNTVIGAIASKHPDLL